MKQCMKELPSELRPMEKCMRLGSKNLSDAELLACILRTGTAKENVLSLSERVIAEIGGSAAGLLKFSLRDLKQIPGIGEVKAVGLLSIAELSKRIQAFEKRNEICFQSPDTVASYYMPLMAHETQETVRVLYLDGRLNLIAEEEISRGTCNSSMVPTREIMVHAIRNDAVNIMLLHNHPSGDPEMSEQDILATKAVENAAKLLNISLVDHIIIGTHGYTSLREKGLIHAD